MDRKRRSDDKGGDGRIPYGSYEVVVRSAEAIIRAIGDDPERESMKKTPERFASAMFEILSGYSENPWEIVNGAIFEQEYSGVVMVNDLKFFSICEHHLLPFFGVCSLAYIPNGRIIGLSKIPRLVKHFSSRFQVQERLTEQIVKFFETALSPKGVAVYIKSYHLCVAMRGARKEDVIMETMYFSGEFQGDGELKRIFLEKAKTSVNHFFDIV